MSFNLSYIVNPQTIKDLPPHLFSTKKSQFIKGNLLAIPLHHPYTSPDPKFPVFNEELMHEAVYQVEEDMELLGISVALSAYSSPDFWELYLNDTPLLETIFVKDVPEEFTFDIVIPVPEGSELRFVFCNGSETEKIVWYNFKFAK